jgi:hypothetical protein
MQSRTHKVKSRSMRCTLALFLFFGLLVTKAEGIGEQHGRITGLVYNSDGAGLFGVNLLLESPSLIGGPRSLSSNEDGSFVFGQLPPGRYQLTATQAGLAAIQKRDLLVSAGKTVSLYLTMELPSQEDVTIVRGERPLVDTTDTTQGTTISSALGEELPNTRLYQDFVTMLPGVIDATGTGNPNIHGSTQRNNRYLLDGLDVTDPVTQTFSTFINFDSIEEIEVLTGGLSAEYNAMGGVINVITKSGSNQLTMDASYIINNATLSPVSAYGDDALSGLLKSEPVRTTLFARSELSLNIGGPIRKDKLWFHASLFRLEDVSSIQIAAPFFIEHPPLTTNAFFTRLKLTYQVAPASTLTFEGNNNPIELTNSRQSAKVFVDPSCESSPNSEECKANNTERHSSLPAVTFFGRLDSALSKDLLFKIQAGVTFEGFHDFPENAAYQEALDLGPQRDSFGQTIDALNFAPLSRLDLQRGTRTVSDFTFLEETRTRIQLDSTMTLLRANLVGVHQFKVGLQASPTLFQKAFGFAGFGSAGDRNGLFVPAKDKNGFRYEGTCGATYDPLTRETIIKGQIGGCVDIFTHGETPADNPFRSLARGLDLGIFLQDEWKPTPFVTVKPGFRVDSFVSSQIINGEKDPILSYNGIGPRFGLAWDPTHDGKTLLSGYAGQVTEAGNLAIPNIIGKSAPTFSIPFDQSRAFYDFENPSVRFGGEGGAIVACDPELLKNPATAELFEPCRPPVLRELSAMFERQVGESTVVGLNSIWRHQYHMFEDEEVNLILDERGANVIGAVNGDQQQSVSRLSTPDEAFIGYTGLDLYLRGQPSERSQLMASYTLSKNTGTKAEETNTQFTLFMDNPRQNLFAEGLLPADHRHSLKLNGSYAFDFGLTLGATYSYLSGGSFDHLFNNTNPAFRGFVDRRAPRGFDPGADLNDTADDFALRLPDSNQLDLRTSYDIASFSGQQRLTFLVDVFNAFNRSTPTAVDQQDGPNFGTIVGRQFPLRVELGVRFIY